MTQLEKNEFNQVVGSRIENWQPVAVPGKKNMQGNYCTLEAMDIDKHASQLFHSFSVNNAGETWTYLPYGPFATCNDFINWLREKIAEQDTELYAICDNKTRTPIGICGYLRMNPEHGVIEIGHVHFSKLLQKTPLATEAMYLMMYRIFAELGYRRYEWKCDSLNQASRRAAERLGFKFEGIFRQCNVVKNRNRDTAWFSIIDSEWLQIKQRFQKWLSPENFDKEGNQVISLSSI